MRGVTIVLALLVLFQVSQAAVLVRFINTVPQRFNRNPLAGTDRTNGYDAAGMTPDTIRYNEMVDRVGLQYFPSQSSRTLVWTELVDDTRPEILGAGATTPFAYTFAMPPLRGAHRLKEAEARTTDIDGVSTYAASQHTANTEPNDPTICSTYEQTTLKGDGVGGYLSFAPGTYRMSAYGVLGLATATVADINSQQRVDYTDSTFTFEDNKVYTLVAYGNGALAASPVGTGNTVKLALITESVASAPFGKASIRFFHAIQTAAAVSLNIAAGSTGLANGIGFGSVSDYTTVKATKSVHFSVSRSDSPTKDETDITQVHDIRAGLRATLICAINSLEATSVFCRMIPSRVVAYVRLVHDAADKQQLVQGKFGPQKLSETKLSLWASFEYPRPQDVAQWSQDMDDSVSTGHPLTTRGLYPVVSNVAANTVSGYGEVHVPQFIMDFAVRFIVGFSPVTITNAAAAMNNNANRIAPNVWFHYAPIFKRVSFVLKTDGYATMAGERNGVATALAFPGVVAGATFHVGTFSVGANSITNSLLTDIYMQPGEFYTVFAIGHVRTGNLLRIQTDAMVRFNLRRDLNVDDVHNDLLTTSGSVVFVPFARRVGGTGGADQVFGDINIAGPGSAGTNQVRSWANNGVEDREIAINLVLTTAVTGWPVSQRALQLTAGTYTYSQVTAGTTCVNNLPSGSFTIQNGVRTEIFVLNTEGCTSATNSLSSLVTVTTTFQSAASSGHAPAATAATSVRRSRAVPYYSAASSASSSISLLLAALLALVALFA